MGGVWLQYFPLCLNLVSVGLLLLVFQALVEKQQIQLTMDRSYNISHCLSEMQRSVNQGAYKEINLQQEYGRWIMQGTNTYIKDKRLIIPAYEHWNKQLNELWASQHISRESSKSFLLELQHKLSLSKQLNEEMLSNFASEVRQKDIYIKWGLGMALLGFTVSVFQMYFFFTQRFYKPLEKLTKQTGNLMDHNNPVIALEEYHSLIKPLAFNISSYHEQVNRLRLLTEQIGAGNFEQKINSFENSGAFGEILLKMREKLQANAEEEKKRAWSSKGMDDFSRVLRHQHDTDQENLCKKIISSLVPYIGANQGGIFLHEGEGEEAVLELKAAYAWGRQKYIKKTYNRGEGLIGQLVLDPEMILLTDVPEDFITIGSGLGHAKPACIVLLPLVANDSFQGVLELASFRCFQEHELNFLKNLCESIAAVVFRLRVNEHTRQLLEEANESNMHLRSQEEELRQSTEELISTQEEMLRKETELKSLFNSIDNALLLCELNAEGERQTVITNINRKLAGFFQISEEESFQMKLFELIEVPEWKERDYDQLWQDLLEGSSFTLECRKRNCEDQWLSASFSPVFNGQGAVKKIMMLASDISEKKKADLEFVTQAESIMKQEETLRSFTEELKKLQQELEEQIHEMSEEKAKNIAILDGCVDGVVSFNEDGRVEFFNASAEEIWKISASEVLGRKIHSLIPVEIQEKDKEMNIYYSKNGQKKELDMRTEVLVQEATGNEVEVLLTLTKVKVNGRYTFTAFAQKVAVELF